MDKGKLPTKMFLRSNSFQKLCSLAHPMRLRGMFDGDVIMEGRVQLQQQLH